MSATIEKKRINKKEEFKNYLLELLQEDYSFRQKVFQILIDVIPTTQHTPRRSKEEWKTLSKENIIEWSDIKTLQKLFRKND